MNILPKFGRLIFTFDTITAIDLTYKIHVFVLLIYFILFLVIPCIGSRCRGELIVFNYIWQIPLSCNIWPTFLMLKQLYKTFELNPQNTYVWTKQRKVKNVLITENCFIDLFETFDRFLNWAFYSLLSKSIFEKTLLENSISNNLDDMKYAYILLKLC